MDARQARLSRAPPLQMAGKVPPQDLDHAGVRRRLAWWSGLCLGWVWAFTLLATLARLDRVPLVEATLWSVLSGAVLWRTFYPAARSLLDHWLGEASIELGMRDPLATRAAVAVAMARRGYVLQRHRLLTEAYAPRRWPGLFPALHIAWSGPGGIVTGPRWLVRLVARKAVG